MLVRCCPASCMFALVLPAVGVLVQLPHTVWCCFAGGGCFIAVMQLA